MQFNPPIDLAKPEDYLLSHPLRMQKFMQDTPSFYKGLLGDHEWLILSQALDSENFSLSSITELLQIHQMPMLKGLLEASSDESLGSTEIGGAMPMLATLRHLMTPYRLFRLEDDLVKLLSLTDVDSDVPVSYLNLPFNRCYVEFGRKRNVGINVLNSATGLHILEGCYIEKVKHPQRGNGLYILFTGSPLGKDNVIDDATSGIYIETDNPELSINDALDRSFRFGVEQAAANNLVTPIWDNEMPDALNLLCKALLYINMADTRKSISLRYTEHKKQIDGLKSPGKKAKALRQLSRLTDEVVIHAPAGAGEQLLASEAATQGGKRAHWRRGHYRNQRHGKNYELLKLIFIAPTLINADQVTSASKPTSKSYIVS